MPRSSTKRAAPPKKRKIERLENDERRAQLLALGREAFSNHSYDEVSIDELAKKAKLSKGLFYYYFPTKRDLYIAGLTETASELSAKLVASVAAAPKDPRSRTIAGVEAYLAHVEKAGPSFVALMRGGIGSDPQVAAVIDRVRGGVLEEFMQGAPIAQFLKARPLAKIAIRAWIGMVEAASIEWLATREPAREAVRDLLVDMLFAMLLKVLDPKDAPRYA